jgi:hypothetical protein
MEIRGSVGLTLRLKEGRTANRNNQLFEQSFHEDAVDAGCIPFRFLGLYLVSDQGIEIGPSQVDTVVTGFQSNRNVGVGRRESPESRYEPPVGYGRNRENPKASLPGFAPVAFGCVMNLGEDLLDIAKKPPSPRVQANAVSTTFEQGSF